ncbi:hypothetical protein HNQ51_002405 [Inhella inkyongensis]|uniref:Uncharacterized protein n=1 Tax=Inhella inkyongensis TaxID=392593 RepID=A0A840S7T9_9BURK|nr:hypothetical protein [Inhella inkyongensis]MBB5205086.1 hypothetical protein [Inhella inkyongensis]
MSAAEDDPLWLNSPHKRLAFRAACYALFVLLGAAAGWLSGGFWGMLATGTAMLAILISARGWIERSLGELWRRSVQGLAAPAQGQHYAFAGQSLDIHDDGRELWIAERSVRRLLDLDRDLALKARFSNQWRESRELGLRSKGLWIKVTALHQHLADAPDRMDPRRLRLRTYLDRDVLQPTARRRAL